MPTFARGFWTYQAHARNTRLRRGLDEETATQPITPRRDLSEAVARDRTVIHLISRDGDHCYLCQQPQHHCDYEIDHIIARSHGGTDDYSNLAIACKSCNCRKSNLIVSFKVSDRMVCYRYPTVSRGW